MSNLCVLACSLRFGVREGSRRLVLPPEGRGLRAQGPASLGRALELLHVESFTSQTVTPYTETLLVSLLSPTTVVPAWGLALPPTPGLQNQAPESRTLQPTPPPCFPRMTAQ